MSSTTHNPVKLHLSVKHVPLKSKWQDLTPTRHSLESLVLVDLQLIVQSTNCSELRVIKHLQGVSFYKGQQQGPHTHFTSVTL